GGRRRGPLGRAPPRRWCTVRGGRGARTCPRPRARQPRAHPPRGHKPVRSEGAPMSITVPAPAVVEGTEMLEPDLQELARRVRAFADDVVAPAAYEYDTERRLPIEIIHQMGEMGLFGLPLPQRYDGQGKSYLHLCVAVEQLARVDQSIAVTLEAGLGLGAMPVYRFGTEEQKD